MKVRLIAVGTKMPDWVQTGINEYAKRLGNELKLETVEIPLGHRGKNTDINKAIANESKQMLDAVGADDWVVALDERGAMWDTQALAGHMADWRMEGRTISLLVGGPDGLSDPCRQRAQQTWSLSRLTFPHPVVRIILAEQLYRAVSVLKGHPYHR